MTGRELLRQLGELDSAALDLPFLAITVNTRDREGVRVSDETAGPHPWVPSPILHVASMDVEMTDYWRETSRSFTQPIGRGLDRREPAEPGVDMSRPDDHGLLS